MVDYEWLPTKECRECAEGQKSEFMCQKSEKGDEEDLNDQPVGVSFSSSSI